MKLSPEEIKGFLKTAKTFSERKNTSPVFELKKIIEAKKRKIIEEQDISRDNKLSAKKENYQKRKENIKKQETENAKNQTENAKNQTENGKNQSENAKKAAENKGRTRENEDQKAKNLIEMKLISEQQKLIKAAKESYQNLSPDLKQHSPEEINTKISSLSPNTKARLKKSGLSLSDYAQFSLAREKIASLDTKTPEGETFLTTLKKMEKSLGIVEKTDGGYPLSNEPRKETFEQNPQLMEFAKNDESLKSLEKVNVLDDKLNIKQQQKIFQLF